MEGVNPPGSRRPARYFPVRDTPFRFRAGLAPFGADYGNGEADRQFFQLDSERDLYLAEKRKVDPARHHIMERDDTERTVLERVSSWIQETLRREHPDVFPAAPESFSAAAEAVQEDLVVMHRRDGIDAAIAVHVSFPSDWYPDRIAGTDFRFIHGPVPGFADTPPQAASMVASMIERGPYVRFVWTLKPDDHLDHHPEQGRHGAWREGSRGFLRVERQVTMPFQDVEAALFLIRTYLYPFDSLGDHQRRSLARAVKAMPAAAARYKGIDAALPVILSLLEPRMNADWRGSD